MPTSIPDLWPPEVFTPTAVTPIAVLRHQGEALGAHTQNFVHGDVETTSDEGGKVFTHTLYLVAPLLRYRKPLLNVTNGLKPFPASVVETPTTKQPKQKYWSATVTTEQELQDALRTFFNEARVKEILQSVINMSNDVAPPEGNGR